MSIRQRRAVIIVAIFVVVLGGAYLVGTTLDPVSRIITVVTVISGIVLGIFAVNNPNN